LPRSLDIVQNENGGQTEGSKTLGSDGYKRKTGAVRVGRQPLSLHDRHGSVASIDVEGEPPPLLWIACAAADRRPEVDLLARRYFKFHTSVLSLDVVLSDIMRIRPRLLCFDFDYPDQKQLQVMQIIKAKYMSLPVLMLTVAHSEALAVWAFRVRVWNYLVKPVAAAEFDHNMKLLRQVVSAKRPDGRKALAIDAGLPVDIPVHNSMVAAERLRPAAHFIEGNLNRKLSSQDVADVCGMGHASFLRAFKATFGCTFKMYLTGRRMQEAGRLLRETRTIVANVAYTVGFSDHSYFDRLFKAHFGVTPSAYAGGAQPTKTLPPNPD
jgi:AraC-like DNA-binding protein